MSLRHPLLEAIGVEHGFGLRGVSEPAGLLRPKQVHGREVVSAEACRAEPAPSADAVFSREPGVPIGVATADCVPILCTSASGDLVAAIHAGWRGLAQGVVASSLDVLRHLDADADWTAAIGPHIGVCCYEVDEPVLDALRQQLGEVVLSSSVATRPGHRRIDLGELAAHALETSGVTRARIGRLPSCCTRCDAQRFHSYRRDGARAGRLVHHIAARVDRPGAHG